MMNGPEKSDPGILATKPANKAGQPACGANCGEPTAAESVEPRAGTKGSADQQSTRRTQRQGSVTQALERIRHAIAVWTRGGSRMRESRKSGSVRGALGQRASLPRLPAIVALHESADGPGCVKTHTSAKCRKYNSPAQYQVVCT
jgi:hypothetical protein